MRKLVLAGLVASLALGGCVSQSSGGAVQSVPRTQRDVISTAEIAAASDVPTAYDLVQRLRPTMLQSRGGRSSYPVVYMDNVQFGGLDALRQVRSEQIKEIRFISAADATTRWGTNHDGGVILIISKGG